MRCPNCGHLESKVIDSRSSESADSIRRRRECTKCGERFTTYERREENPVLIVKKDGRREPFDRAKIFNGLVTATIKRNIPYEQLNDFVDQVESDLRNNFRNEISSQELGDLVLIKLKRLDKVAYIRFASVYKDFKDLEEFNKELQTLNKTESDGLHE